MTNMDSLNLRSLTRTFASAKKVYPTMASAVTVTAAAPASIIYHIDEA